MALLFRRIVGPATTVVTAGVVGSQVEHGSQAAQAEHRPPHRSPIYGSVELNQERDADGDYWIVDNKGPEMPMIVAPEVHVDAAHGYYKENPEALVDTIREHPLAPRSSSSCLRLVNRLLNDESVVVAMKQKIARNNQAVAAAQALHDAKQSSDAATAELMWNQLRAEFFCALCQDVLAAPVVFQCSHSFCGICVNQMMESCVECDIVPANMKSNVLHHCPECRQEVKSASYERMLNGAICKRVNEVPDCEMKTLHHERREAYEKFQREEQAKTRPKSTSTFENAVAGATGTRAQRPTTAPTQEDAETEAWYETLKEWAVPYLAFAVLALVVIGSYSRR